MLVFTTALTFWVASLNVRYRDVGHLLNLALLVWFWATPIVYQGWLVQEKLQTVRFLGIDLWTLYLLNPVAVIVLGFQRALYSIVVPAPGEEPILPPMSLGTLTGLLLAVLAVSVLLLFLAWRSFFHSLRRFRGGAVTTAIAIDGISKMFRLYRERPTSLKQRLLVSRSRSEEFWALRDVIVRHRRGILDGTGRSQRLREDHAAEVHRGDPQADRRHDPVSGEARRPPRARRRLPPRPDGTGERVPRTPRSWACLAGRRIGSTTTSSRSPSSRSSWTTR